MTIPETAQAPEAARYIQIAGLTRQFKERIALDEIDLTIRQGELFGIVGPDGAGKTTLLRILAGILQISSGDVQAAGVNLSLKPEAVKPRIGYMAQEFSLYEKLSVLENLRFFGDLYNVPPAIQQERIPDLLQFAQLTRFQNHRAGQLSGGMKKKLALASTLMHRPPLLLLDEPTTGVDPVSRREFWRILNTLHLDGTTIVVSTPYMDEADRCSMVGLMYQGKIIHCAPPGVIRSQAGTVVLKVICDDWRKGKEILSSLNGIQEIQSYGESLHLLAESRAPGPREINRQLEREGLKVIEIREIAPRMEEAFISIIRNLEGSA